MRKNPYLIMSFRITFAACLCLAIGCSSKSDLKLAPADGVVTYMDKPLAGATVMFSPAKGPLATAITDKDGKYQLKTESRQGIAPGLAKVAITMPAEGETTGMAGVAQQPKSAAEAQEYLKQSNEIRKTVAAGKMNINPKSSIPEKYTKFESSGLSFTIKSEGDNHNNIALQQ